MLLRMPGQLSRLRGLVRSLVVVLGRVVPLLGCLDPLLAGPASSQMIPLARRVASLVVKLLPWLAGQFVASLVRWLSLVPIPA